LTNLTIKNPQFATFLVKNPVKTEVKDFSLRATLISKCSIAIMYAVYKTFLKTKVTRILGKELARPQGPVLPKAA
jgi:hypothetical protein